MIEDTPSALYLIESAFDHANVVHANLLMHGGTQGDVCNVKI